MQMIGLTKEQCIEELRSYLDEIDRIQRLFKAESILSWDDKILVKELVKKLKERFRADLKPRKTVRGQKQMGNVERNVFYHAIYGAYVDHITRINLNSTPDNGWSLNLGGAEIDIDIGLDQLQGKTD